MDGRAADDQAVRALYFAAGLLAGTYLGAYLLNAWRPIIPDPFPSESTSGGVRFGWPEATSPAT